MFVFRMVNKKATLETDTPIEWEILKNSLLIFVHHPGLKAELMKSM